MAKPAKRTVMLREGMKFSESVKRDGRSGRVRHVGPCEVQMTEGQIEKFKDLLQTAPQVVASKPVEPDEGPEPETEPPPKSKPAVTRTRSK